jgi:acyl carrier protein
MTAAELVPRIRKVFRSVFGSEIVFDATLSRTQEPRWTSLKHVEFIISLENEFGVRFDGADATDMTSIATVIEKVGQRLS